MISSLAEFRGAEDDRSPGSFFELFVSIAFLGEIRVYAALFRLHKNELLSSRLFCVYFTSDMGTKDESLAWKIFIVECSLPVSNTILG